MACFKVLYSSHYNVFLENEKCLNGKETKLDFVLIWCDLINMPHERRIRFQNVKDEKKTKSRKISRET